MLQIVSALSTSIFPKRGIWNLESCARCSRRIEKPFLSDRFPGVFPGFKAPCPPVR
jgi:hypothetical protein